MKDRFGHDWTDTVGTRFWRRPHIGRRMFFRHAASAIGGYMLLPSRPAETVARAGVSTKGTAKNCIFVLMSGGPSHVDTFDLKEGAWTPAAFQPTSYGDVRWPTGLMPNLANQLDNVSFIRSMKSWALVHVLARTWVQIGRNPAQSNARFAPHIGSVVSSELSWQQTGATLPVFVALNTNNGPGAGFLSSDNSPFYSSPGGGGLANTTHRDGSSRFDRRYGLLTALDADLKASQQLGPAVDETFAYNAAAKRLMYNPAVDKIFTFDALERNRYGNTGFGNACIAARNMLRNKSGVRFIQINTSDWDHHENIYAPNGGHFSAAKQFDFGMASLLADLKSDGLLDETLVFALGEFGRVPGPINNGLGRDHYAQQSILLAGGGIKPKNIIGSTDDIGKATKDPGWSRSRDIRPEDVEATIYSALGIDYTKVLEDPSGRGFYYVPFSDRDQYGPINELWG
jgi:hypothetical protein